MRCTLSLGRQLVSAMGFLGIVSLEVSLGRWLDVGGHIGSFAVYAKLIGAAEASESSAQGLLVHAVFTVNAGHNANVNSTASIFEPSADSRALFEAQRVSDLHPSCWCLQLP